ncbi:hypothetical protein BD410DRAFT_843700 [Rickenella mellea]|uniref:Uncharacterized protein n=1 Tax=Rickenella mellea TaxID=50990 RepID=A0A4Y7PQM7_9AGAM|nr:hypothetical protein BD410DRAFT_843700 [Rickenella mellea]
MRFSATLPVLAVLFNLCFALPQFPDPSVETQGLIITAVGTAADGMHTTYEIIQTGTDNGKIPVTETAVVGATDVSFTIDLPEATIAVGGQCGYSSGVAICTVEDNGYTATATVTLADLGIPLPSDMMNM